MSNLDDVLGSAFYEQEQQEAKSKQIEDLIKSYDGASALLPPRQYGKPINPEKYGLTLRSIIEKNNPHLAAFLGISSDSSTDSAVYFLQNRISDSSRTEERTALE